MFSDISTYMYIVWLIKLIRVFEAYVSLKQDKLEVAKGKVKQSQERNNKHLWKK